MLTNYSTCTSPLRNGWIFLAFLFSFSFSFTSCKKDSEPVYEVPAELQFFIDNFQQEAAIRGETLNIDHLIVRYNNEIEVDDSPAAGVCFFEHNDNPPTIELDTTSLNWSNSDQTREFLVFHELGHCILNRRHKENRLPNDNFASLMKASGNPVINTFNSFKRDYYLDELFDETTPPPSWALNFPNYFSVGERTPLFEDNFVDNSNNWPLGTDASTSREIENGEFVFSNNSSGPFYIDQNVNINPQADYEIEVNWRLESSDPSINAILWGVENGERFNYYGYSTSDVATIGELATGAYVSQEEAGTQSDTYNKFTIRKLGDFTYFYINEQPFDVTSSLQLFGNGIGFFVNSGSTIYVDDLKVYQL